jgi:hypothetical protein
MKRNTNTTWVDPFGQSWDVTVEFKEVDGRVSFASIAIKPNDDGYHLTRRVLTTMPLFELFSDSVSQKQLDFNRWRNQRKSQSLHQGRALTQDELTLIAEIHDAALKANFPVQEAIAKALGISGGTAANRIKAARDRGYIPPSRRAPR